LTFRPESPCVSYLKTPGVKLQSECKGSIYVKICAVLTATVVVPCMPVPVAYPEFFFFGGGGVGSTNSVEDRGQREQGSGAVTP
jgi:hypothetical protein